MRNKMMGKSESTKPNVAINFLSSILFWWLKPFFDRKKDDCINISDLYDVSPENNSQLLGDKLERKWTAELKRSILMNKKPSLLKASCKSFGWIFLYYGIHVFIICVIFRGFQPYVLGRVIEHFDGRAKSTAKDFYFHAIGLIVMVLSQALVGHHSVVGRKVIGMRMSIAYSSLIYRKMLRLSIATSMNYNAGKVINLLSNDVNKFEDVMVFLHYIWILPIQGIVMAYFIWINVGIASLAGIIFLILQAIPVQGYLAKITAKLRTKVAFKTDERVRLMSEIINGIRIIKMYAWEKPFENLVSRARRNEISAILKKSYLRGISVATSAFAESLSLFFVIAAYVLLGNFLQASIVYSLAQYFSMIKVMLTVFYPRAMSSAAEARVSINRVEEFLLLDEIQIANSTKTINNDCGVLMDDMTISWAKKSTDNVLNHINLNLSDGKLFIITGPVGSAKSTFLKAILRELNLVQGILQVNGTISYASQEPWIFPSTIRDNIIFGEIFNEERYEQVVNACALKLDFQTFPNGDLTVVGDRGSTLSGGQCARINLARAVYKNADIYLIDDALAAVDVHVGRHLFDNCINGLLKNKVRILVTHNFKYFEKADEILMFNSGQIKFRGLWSDFKDQELCYSEEHIVLSQDSTEKIQQTETIVSKNTNELNFLTRKTKKPSVNVNDDFLEKSEKSKFIWWRYFRAGGSTFTLLFLALTLLLAQVSVSLCDYWLAHWIKQEENNHKKLFNNNYLTTTLVVFAILLFTSVLTWTASTLLFYKVCMNASKNLHKKMFSCLLKAPMSFYNLNVPGKILNRFSKDTGLVDETLPTITLDALHVILMVIGVVIQVLIINWWMVFPIIIVVSICWKLKNIYLPTAQNIRRLESEAKSPVFSHVNSTITGLTTIRSAKMQEKAKIEFDSLQNIHTSAHYLNIVSGSAFGFWLDIVSISLLAFVILSFICLKNDDIFAGFVGLAITQILMLYGTVQYGLRQTTEMMTQMISVERIFEFTNLEQEENFENKIENTFENWPTNGHIEFKNVCLRYFHNEEAVLKDVSFCINPREKIGIIGRTGAGKSSIISALFRLFDYEGSIHIDGVDIKTCELRSLRSKLSVIPQNPILFTASIKQNLDPLQKYNDEVIWEALKAVGLNDRFDSLNYRIENGGNNLSTGEKQLFCLARAIIAENKVLILDEATANIDSSADQLIQRIVKNKFVDCTILTIAHRLNTILDSDKVLVLDYGQIIEFDSPDNLANRTNGSFNINIV